MIAYRRLFILLIACICCGILAQASDRKKKDKAETKVADWGMVEPDAMPHHAIASQMPSSPSPTLLPEMRTRRSFNPTHREGIDVSHYQGRIDWQRVASEGNVSYAYIKCSEGATIQDEYYRTNIENARRAGLNVGAYHFYRPASSPNDQLNNMTRIALKRDFDLVPIIDIEHRGNESHGRFIANLRQFIEAVARHYNCRPMLYTGQNFYNKYLVGEFDDYLWMIAKYKDGPPELSDGMDYAFWQFTSKARVPGISGNVDRSCLMSGHKLDDIAM